MNNEEGASYYYAGLRAQLGNLSLNDKHPELLPYHSISPFPSPLIGAMLGLCAGRQMTRYIAMELTLEWFISGQRYQVFDSYLSRFSSQPIDKPTKKGSTLYTVGLGLDCIPMVPVSDRVNLLVLIGLGYKKAGVEVLDVEKFDTVGWNLIPRIGLGGIIHDEFLRCAAKFVVEFNNRFQDANKAIFNPSLSLGLDFSLRFPLSKWC